MATSAHSSGLQEIGMTRSIKVVVFGASGRMGDAVMRAAISTSHVQLVAALVRAGSAHTDKPISGLHDTDASNLRFAETLNSAADVLIDFSNAQAFDDALAIALDRKIAFVSGTTGLSETQQLAVRQAAQSIPVLWASNFSLGIAMLTRLVREASRALVDWDCEVSEAHHRHKRDAPSGTALSLGKTIAEARGDVFEQSAIHDRTSASGARKYGGIGFSVVRGGDIVGEHTVYLIGDGERIELTHRAQSRDIFAAGAIRAAAWLAGRPAAFYSIENVLGFTD